jgi:ubiquinone/menaquinone biosynthesis C-methylase UbiE
VRDLPADAVVNSFGCGNPVAFAEMTPGQTVVDLGSGAGIDLLLAAKKVGSEGRVIGIDMTDEMLARARENIAAAGLTNVEVRRGIIEDLPVETGTVDWVISNCVINLSPEKQKVFAEIARVLKPGGHVSVSDMVAEDLPEWIRSHEALYDSCVAGAISEAEYVAGLQAAGLVEIEAIEELAYDASQVEVIVLSEAGEPASGDVADLAAAAAGKVRSVRFTARKPE